MKILFDRERFNELAGYCRDACGVNLFYLSPLGEVRYEPPSMCEICRDIRKVPGLYAECRRCTQEASRRCQESRQMQIYTCHMGFTEVMIPLFLDTVCVGYLNFGQIVQGRSDERIQALLEQHGYLDYGERIRQSTHMDTQKIRATAALMKLCASHMMLDRIVKAEELSLPLLINGYIEENLHRPITSQDLCRAFTISRSQLYNIAQKHYPGGVIAWVRHKRIERACELLRDTDEEIARIATRVGVMDNAYFSRLFKQQTGMTPMEYRKKEGKL